MRRRHGPHVAVLDPTGARRETAVVLARYDEVVGAGRHGPRDVDPFFDDDATGDTVRAGTSVELVHGRGVAGEHQRVQSEVAVGLPRAVERIEPSLIRPCVA